MTTDPKQAMLEELTKVLTDKGQIVGAGWVGFKIAAINPAAPQIQLDEMRMAFFAGALHLFASIMSMLEAGEEPTEKDLQRISMIKKELDEYLKEFKVKIKHNLKDLS